jgi:serine protease AprX
VAYVPNVALAALASDPLVEDISLDRLAFGTNERTGLTVGAAAVRQELGYDGSGVGVAIIDSGITPWHDDLTGAGSQRVYDFVDFITGHKKVHDDYGHGTHVAGIIAGNGLDSGGARSGIAPGAHLIVLRTLDGTGVGHISDVIAALDYVVANKDAYNIRLVNMSVSAGVYESYNLDPLTLAAKRVVEAGIVVVTAAGNAGVNAQGRRQYGGVTAPGNAPWVLTVGASSHMGTIDRSDDSVAGFSSRGPTAVDFSAKPDIVAPGVGIESLADPGSAFYTSKSSYLLRGTVPTPYLPYLSLSGTSMAAPVVSGTVALMLQANPALTPNAVKAILQYTAEHKHGFDTLTEGAGFLNATGAVELARFFAASSSGGYPSTSAWSTQLIWGTHRVRGGRLTPDASAWPTAVAWGAVVTPSGQNVEWGVTCSLTSCGTEETWTPWGISCADSTCTTGAWDTPGSQNIVWGTKCGGADCAETWRPATAGTAVLDASDDDTVVWGSSDDDTVVWGSSDDDTVVWGSSDDDTVVWGSGCGGSGCEPVIWDTSVQ